MAKLFILGSVRNSYLNLPCVLFIIFFSWFLGHSYGELDNSFTVSSSSYSVTKLFPYEWRYIRVDLPPWFSSMSISIESNTDLDYGNLEKLPKSTVPILCLRDGSPPIPDSSDTSLKNLVLHPSSNQTFGGIQNLQNSERCYPMQKNISMQFTNEQISPGIWYIGLFNGLGPTRTQSKMINRGSSYSARANISIRGCSTSTMSGPYCNQTAGFLSCSQSENINQSTGNIISCRNSLQDSCHIDSEPKLYALHIDTMSEQITILASNIGLNNGLNASDFSLTCYARYGAVPLPNLHDYSSDINKSPLTIHLPKAGRWYITIIPSYTSKELGAQNMSTKTCYSMEWRVFQCPVGKAGLNCTWDKYTLRTFFRRSSTSGAFESFYLLDSVKGSADSSNFALEPHSSNSSFDEKIDSAWTYFVVDIPYGASGGNLHIRLNSDTKINYEIYARYGGLPNRESYNYFYGNRTHNSDGSQYFKLYNSSESFVRFYILYAREGSWSFGLRRLEVNSSPSKDITKLFISLERCPNQCSSHGACKDYFDTSGLAIYSYCWCDRTRGGFDCGVEIVTEKGHLWQMISLIASNAAAVFPAFWALRQKAFAEWVIFTCSGISSGLYHACDVGSWCALSFRVLQFMDFWLSFVAVVSTFVHLTGIDEGSKRTIHTVVFIITALMAVNGPTRSSNIYLVISIGAFGLLIGWMLELSTKYRSSCFSTATGTTLTIIQRLQKMKGWLRNVLKTLIRRFRWGFILVGFIALAMAAISWILESSKTYWIWHSMWHVSIYTSSFFFLCSKENAVHDEENQETPVGAYELTRQDSLPRGVQR